MTEVVSKTGRKQYQTEISNGNLSIFADENTANGGLGEGFAPQELLAASLASCTSITLRMYANRKQMDVDDIRVTVSLRKDHDNHIWFERQISVVGSISQEQSDRLLEVADKCPVHKILSQASVIQTLML